MQLSYIHEQKEKLRKEIEIKKQESGRFSFLRFLSIVGFIFGIYQGYYGNHPYFYIVSILLCVVFIYLVIKHNRIKKEIEDTQALFFVYEDIEKRKDDRWKEYTDTGEEFLVEDAKQEVDLDIFGKASLFQYLNCAKTMEGRKYLASLLSWKQQDSEQIKQRQEAVKECISSTDLSLRFMQLSKLFEWHAGKKKKRQMEHFYQAMETHEHFYAKLWKRICIFISVCCVGITAASFFFHQLQAYALILFMGSLCLAFLFYMKNSAVLSSTGMYASIMQDYQRMLEEIEHADVTSAFLQQLKKDCAQADHAILKLQHILQMVQVRNNFILHFIVNGFLLLDFQCVFALEDWKERYGSHVRTWLCAIGKMEAMVSLAQIGLVKDTYCEAKVIEHETPTFCFEKMYHPLIQEKRAVANSFDADNKTYIITGSNMSGKTTFLRTIGINMILFHAGAPLCAVSGSATSMNLYTSMRVHDNVSEGISTFYAEILRIKDMMLASEKKEKMLVLVDEIFKGTNSADRIVCAKTALEKLHLSWIITFVSTHDFELCDMDKTMNAENYHFSEYYEDDKILFDYTLKEGRCTTTNAKQLMKMAGF